MHYSLVVDSGLAVLEDTQLIDYFRRVVLVRDNKGYNIFDRRERENVYILKFF